MDRAVYASLAYARSLGHAGRPLDVPEWSSAVILRDIPDAPGRIDAMGPYPVCVLKPDADIPGGLARLREQGTVSVVLVADPLAGPPAAALSRHFPLCRPFKTHHLIDRGVGPATPSKHHRDRIRRGARHATARRVSLRSPVWQAHWRGLYAGLVARKGITGLQAFPEESLDRLAGLPEDRCVAFAAEAPDGSVPAMQLWIRDGARAYSHLTATSEAGYRIGATYVVYAAALDHLADCEVLDLGGGAGHTDDLADPLAAFKRGFANAAATTWLCGAILDAPAYTDLAAGCGGSFFPAYRGPAPRASLDGRPDLRASRDGATHPSRIACGLPDRGGQ